MARPPNIIEEPTIRAGHMMEAPHAAATARVSVDALAHHSVFQQETSSRHARTRIRMRSSSLNSPVLHHPSAFSRPQPALPGVSESD